MKNITVQEVTTRRQQRQFVEFPKKLYADNPNYVPDMDNDIYDLLPRLTAYLAYDEKGQVVGRVTAFINQKANDRWQRRAVRFSHIDFIDDPDVCRALLSAVEAYGRAHQMDEAMGPLGFFDFDKEGLLTEGFDRMSSIIEYYNAPYYATYLEQAGYEKEAEWVQTHVVIPKEVPPVFKRVSEFVRRKGYHVVKLTNKQIAKEGYGRRIFDLFNDAYKNLFGFSEMPTEQVDAYINQYLKLIDKQIIPVILDREDNIVGAAITMGSLSHATRKSNGRYLPFGWWHLLRALYWKREDTVNLLLIAVKPELQGHGINALLFDDLIPIYNRLGFKWAETGPQLEDNIKELSQWEPLNPTISKRRRCYGKKL